MTGMGGGGAGKSLASFPHLLRIPVIQSGAISACGSLRAPAGISCGGLHPQLLSLLLGCSAAAFFSLVERIAATVTATD